MGDLRNSLSLRQILAHQLTKEQKSNRSIIRAYHIPNKKQRKLLAPLKNKQASKIPAETITEKVILDHTEIYKKQRVDMLPTGCICWILETTTGLEEEGDTPWRDSQLNLLNKLL
jgi:hypothetical protein